jgi:hypothetical protein
MNVSIEPGRRWLILMLSVTLVLAGCSNGSDKPEPTPTPEPSPTAPLAPGQKTVRDLLAGVETAWPAVTSVRTVFSTTDTSGTPGAATAVTTEEYIAPDRRRIIVSAGDTVVDEQIAIGSSVFMRGSFVVSAVAPMLGPDTWVTVDPSLVPPDSPVGNVVTYLTQPYHLSILNVSDDLLPRGVSQMGPRDIDGRSCMVWGFVDTTDFGDRIDYELALDDQGLPCSLVERAGTVENVTTFAFNVPEMHITAPDSAQPVSGTPEG